MTKTTSEKTERDRRLAEQLRANLRRRKTQSRERHDSAEKIELKLKDQPGQITD